MGIACELKGATRAYMETERYPGRLQMLFEVLVLLLTLWNVFDRPRMASLRLASALHRDGITFFMVRSPCYHEVDHIHIGFVPGSHRASRTESRSSHY
jgi:hypothetical protein